jgi:hypothetical protein
MDSWGGVPLILLGVVLLAALGVAVFLFVKLLRMGRVARSTNMPQQGKIAFWIGLAYSVSPLDLLRIPSTSTTSAFSSARSPTSGTWRGSTA